MKVLLATTADNAYGGVFGTAYKKAGGIPFDAILILDERKAWSYPIWAQGYVAWKLFGFRGTCKYIRIRFLKSLLTVAEKEMGLHMDWIPSIKCEQTDIYYEKSINSSSSVDLVTRLKPDLLISVGVPNLIRKEVLDVPRIGAINLHNGSIPKFRGLFGTFWEVFSGEDWSCTCIHEMTSRVDSGSMIASERLKIADFKNFLDLFVEKKRRGGQLLAQLLKEVGTTEKLVPVADIEGGGEDQYRKWPNLKDIGAFKWRKTF